MRLKHVAMLASVVALGTALPSSANAATTLTFEGLSDGAAINNYYNGGAGGNLGIQFVNGVALVDSDAGGGGNFANEPSASTVMYFTSGSASTMNIAAGFTQGFSFFYSANGAGSVSVYDGLNGTGTVLGTLSLASQYNTNCSGDPTGSYCNWSAIGVSFAGTARSVNFGGAANYIAFDNITLGAATPGAVPEPATWAMMTLGFGLAGAALRRRRKATARVRFA